MKPFPAIVACCAVLFPAALLGAPSTASLRDLPEPVSLTAEEDHGRMLKLLGIGALRPGVSGRADAPNPANYDEARATRYPTLPDPLRFDNGAPLTQAAQWPQRRAELVSTSIGKCMGGCQRQRRPCAGSSSAQGASFTERFP